MKKDKIKNEDSMDFPIEKSIPTLFSLGNLINAQGVNKNVNKKIFFPG